MRHNENEKALFTASPVHILHKWCGPGADLFAGEYIGKNVASLKPVCWWIRDTPTGQALLGISLSLEFTFVQFRTLYKTF